MWLPFTVSLSPYPGAGCQGVASVNGLLGPAPGLSHVGVALVATSDPDDIAAYLRQLPGAEYVIPMRV